MTVAARRLFRVAIAAQVCRDDREPLRQAGRDLAPRDMRLRMSMEQKQARPSPANRDMDARAAGLNVGQSETRHQGRRGRHSCFGVRDNEAAL